MKNYSLGIKYSIFFNISIFNMELSTPCPHNSRAHNFELHALVSQANSPIAGKQLRENKACQDRLSLPALNYCISMHFCGLDFLFCCIWQKWCCIQQTKVKSFVYYLLQWMFIFGKLPANLDYVNSKPSRGILFTEANFNIDNYVYR